MRALKSATATAPMLYKWIAVDVEDIVPVEGLNEADGCADREDEEDEDIEDAAGGGSAMPEDICLEDFMEEIDENEECEDGANYDNTNSNSAVAPSRDRSPPTPTTVDSNEDNKDGGILWENYDVPNGDSAVSPSRDRLPPSPTTPKWKFLATPDLVRTSPIHAMHIPNRVTGVTHPGHRPP